MPVEIKQLSIRLSIESDGAEEDALTHQDLPNIVDLCTEQVLKSISFLNER